MDCSLVNFCNQLGIPHFSDDQLEMILSSDNFIVRILKTNRFHNFYQTYVGYARNFISEVKNTINNLDDKNFMVSPFNDRMKDEEKQFIKIIGRQIIVNHLKDFHNKQTDKTVKMSGSVALVGKSNGEEIFVVSYDCIVDYETIDAALKNNIVIPELKLLAKKVSEFSSHLEKELVEIKTKPDKHFDEYYIDLFDHKGLNDMLVNKLQDVFVKFSQNVDGLNKQNKLSQTHLSTKVEDAVFKYKRSTEDNFTLDFSHIC